MKNLKGYFLMVAIVFAANSFAQDQAPVGIKYGVKAGVNFANLTVKPADAETESSSLVGLTAGVFATIPGAAGFAVQPEVNYSGLGAKDKGSDAKLVLNYLTIPVLAEYTFEENGFGAYIGPQIGFLLSAKTKAGGASENAKENFKSTDFSGVVGVEYFLPVGVGLSARYQLGFTNIAKDPDTGESVKNKALTITIGYRF